MSRHPLINIIVLLFMVLGVSPASRAADPAQSLSSFTLPSDPITFQSGPGSEIARGYCLICHSAEYIYMQPPHAPERWEEIVKKMQRTFGCPIPNEQIPPLVRYLVSQNAIQPEPAPQDDPGDQKQDSQELSTSSGDSGKGKRVYDVYCVNCHGTSGKGDGPIGQVLVPPAADLTATGKKSDKELLNTIQHGRKGTAMPGWKHDLSSADILNVLSYIRRLSQQALPYPAR